MNLLHTDLGAVLWSQVEGIAYEPTNHFHQAAVYPKADEYIIIRTKSGGTYEITCKTVKEANETRDQLIAELSELKGTED